MACRIKDEAADKSKKISGKQWFMSEDHRVEEEESVGPCSMNCLFWQVACDCSISATSCPATEKHAVYGACFACTVNHVGCFESAQCDMASKR